LSQSLIATSPTTATTFLSVFTVGFARALFLGTFGGAAFSAFALFFFGQFFAVFLPFFIAFITFFGSFFSGFTFL